MVRITVQKQCGVCGVWTNLCSGEDPAEVEKVHDREARLNGWEIGYSCFCPVCKGDKTKELSI